MRYLSILILITLFTTVWSASKTMSQDHKPGYTTTKTKAKNQSKSQSKPQVIRKFNTESDDAEASASAVGNSEYEMIVQSIESWAGSFGTWNRTMSSPSTVSMNNTSASKKRKKLFPWLNPNLWSKWETTGKNTFVRECKKFLSREVEDANLLNGHFPSLDYDDLFSRATIELIRAGYRGLLKQESVLKVIQEFITFDPRAASLISDSFSVVDQESSLFIDSKERENFNELVKNCTIISTSLCEVLDVESVQEIGIINKTFAKKFIQIKTRIYFKQQKFNLFREETEGYGKVISELNCTVGNNSHEKMTKTLQCHIGRFNLDPNRVIDLVLEAFEKQPICGFFVPLLKSLKPSSETICEIIGFKLLSLDPPYQTLHNVVALLLHEQMISLEEIYPWLKPLDNSIRKQWLIELKQAKEYANKSMIVTIKEKEVVEDPIDLMNFSVDRYSENQKYCLCEALLSIGAWEEAKKIIKRLPEFSCVSNKRIAVNLIKMLHFVFDPLYRKTHSVSLKMGSIKVPPLLTGLDHLNQVTSFDEFSNDDNIEMILKLGPYIYHDPVLIYKLLRIIKAYLTGVSKDTCKSSNDGLYFKILTIFDESILPSLNFLEANCGISEEIWNCLKLYPYHLRFRLYGAWKGESKILLHPSLLKFRVDMFKRVKHLMRRLSKENVKQMGRQLGKLSHAHPTLIFDYILSQVQLFENLIVPIVDALKFLTSLSYDILCFCLLEALSPYTKGNGATQSITVMLMPNRPRTKHDGSTIANWVQNLSSFAASICKKYPIDLVPLLQYVSNQLKNRQCLDLLLLKEIVQKMSGIEASDEMTSDQLQSMAGGELLRGEAGYFGQIRTAKKSSSRLKEASNINNLAVSMCILMAQQRNCIIYSRESSKDMHAKLLGKLFDQCQDTLVQFGTFMANSNTLDDYGKKIPSLEALYNEYFVTSEVAFFLWRPLFNSAISIKYDELRKGGSSSVQKKHKYTEAANKVHAPIVEMIRNSILPKSFDGISAQFYVTFWSINLYDLYVPAEAYNREIQKVKQLALLAGENKDLNSSKRKKEQERHNTMIEKLLDEQKRQKDHIERVISKLSAEKDTWFASRSAKSAKNEAVTAFLQLCIFPRCIFTSPDAIYCAHFVNTIHSLSTPNFSTLICFDRIFCDIIYTVASCTENEANRYGLFLCTLLEGVMKWHGDKAIFDRECASFPGFVTKFRAANAANTESNDHVDYENFRHVCHKWHYKITKSMIVCLESKDFIQIRNALLVLKRILPYYPKVSNLASAIERWIERVRSEEKDKRQDLFALATSYIGQLKARWNNIIPEEQFHQKTPAPKKTQIATAATATAVVPVVAQENIDKNKTNRIPVSGSISGTSSGTPVKFDDQVPNEEKVIVVVGTNGDLTTIEPLNLRKAKKEGPEEVISTSTPDKKEKEKKPTSKEDLINPTEKRKSSSTNAPSSRDPSRDSKRRKLESSSSSSRPVVAKDDFPLSKDEIISNKKPSKNSTGEKKTNSTAVDGPEPKKIRKEEVGIDSPELERKEREKKSSEKLKNSSASSTSTYRRNSEQVDLARDSKRSTSTNARSSSSSSSRKSVFRN